MCTGNPPGTMRIPRENLANWDFRDRFADFTNRFHNIDVETLAQYNAPSSLSSMVGGPNRGNGAYCDSREPVEPGPAKAAMSLWPRNLGAIVVKGDFS